MPNCSFEKGYNHSTPVLKFAGVSELYCFTATRSALADIYVTRHFMDYVQLRSFDNYIEANIVMSMLQDAQVTCYLKDEHIVTIDPLLSPAVGGIKLMVHAEHVKRAWDLMDAAEEQYLKDIPCPVCKACALKAVSVTRKHTGKLSAVISMILNGQSVEMIKLYQCTACGYDFKELPKER